MTFRGMVCFAFIVAMTLLQPSDGAARPKSVFRSQALITAPEFDDDVKKPALQFVPAWTYAGFRAPLAGDPVPTPSGLVAGARDGEIVALELALGQPYWRTLLGANLSVGPAVVDGLVLQAADDGSLYALDMADGRVVWSVGIDGMATVPPMPDGRRVLVPTDGEVLVAIDPLDGHIAVRRPLPGRVDHPPAVDDGLVVLGTDHGMVLALDAEDLSREWRRYLRYPVTSPVLIDKGLVFVATGDRRVHCLRLKNGRQKWSYRFGSIVTAAMFVRGKFVYVLCYDNDIYVMRRKNGHLVARVRLDHRLDRSADFIRDRLLVVPFTEAAVVELLLPGLRPGGEFRLDRPGEWFTTAPVVFGDRVAVGFGRSAGQIIALDMLELNREDVAMGDRMVNVSGGEVASPVEAAAIPPQP